MGSGYRRGCLKRQDSASLSPPIIHHVPANATRNPSIAGTTSLGWVRPHSATVCREARVVTASACPVLWASASA